MTSDYTTVTECPGDKVTREGLDMLVTRYAFARELVLNKDVLEVACGAGQGLDVLAKSARSVVGGDFTGRLLAKARSCYGGSMRLVRLDGQKLPFRDGTFDVVLVYEAVYYFESAESLLRECARVLRPEGIVVLCTVNKEWRDFNPSPFATTYLSAAELKHVLSERFDDIEISGAFTAIPGSPRQAAAASLKRLAVRLGLVPKTMRGKEWLKRMFMGKLLRIPSRLNIGLGTYHAPSAIMEPTAPQAGWKILFAIARAK